MSAGVVWARLLLTYFIEIHQTKVDVKISDP